MPSSFSACPRSSAVRSPLPAVRQGRIPSTSSVISYGFWQRHFGGDANVLGQTMQLDHERYQVIGVVPPRFLWRVADAYIPRARVVGPRAGPRFRRPPEAWRGTRTRRSGGARADEKPEPQKFPEGFPLSRSRPMVEGLRNDLRGTLLLFLVAVSVLLAVGCANVSILMLARGTARQPEMALRAAIGASRVRLVCHLLTEVLAPTSAGGVLGVLLAFGGLAMLARLLPQGTFLLEADLRVNVPVLLLATAITFATGMLAGLCARPSVLAARSSGCHAEPCATGVDGGLERSELKVCSSRRRSR